MGSRSFWTKAMRATLGLGAGVFLSLAAEGPAASAGRDAVAVAPAVTEGMPAPGPAKPRTVTMLVLGDSSFRRDARWTVEVTRIVMDVNMSFRGAGLKFVVSGFDYWEPVTSPIDSVSPARTGGRFLRGLLPRLLLYRNGPSAAGGPARGPADILVGIVPVGPERLVNPGISDYLGGLVVIKRFTPTSGMGFALLHELCHLFGAIDLRETGSVMSLSRASFAIDGFTREIMRVNWQRSFRPGEFPLDENGTLQAMDLYAKRKARGLDEREVEMFLQALRSELARRR